MTDWIPHDGGLCPVRPGTMVDVRLFAGHDYFTIPAEQLSWAHYGVLSDIIAYRIAKEPKT